MEKRAPEKRFHGKKGPGKKGPGKKGPANCETHAKIQNFHIIRGI